MFWEIHVQCCLNLAYLKRRAIQLFGFLKDVKLFTLKFHLIDHASKDLSRFWVFGALGDSWCEKFNFIIKKLIKMTWKRKANTIEGIWKAMNENTSSMFPPIFSERKSWRRFEKYFVYVCLNCWIASSLSSFVHLTKNDRASFLNAMLSYINEWRWNEPLMQMSADMTVCVLCVLASRLSWFDFWESWKRQFPHLLRYCDLTIAAMYISEPSIWSGKPELFQPSGS